MRALAVIAGILLVSGNTPTLAKGGLGWGTQQEVLKEKLAIPQAFVSQTGQSPQSVTVAAGKPAKIEMHFRILPGYHINSSQPGSQWLIPTKLRLSPPTDIGTGRVKYPPGKNVRFEFAPDEPLNVYEGDLTISAVVSAARYAMPAKYKIHGVLHYQACDNRTCFPARQLPVTVDVRVVKSSIRDPRPAAPRRTNPAQSPHIKP